MRRAVARCSHSWGVALAIKIEGSDPRSKFIAVLARKLTHGAAFSLWSWIHQLFCLRPPPPSQPTRSHAGALNEPYSVASNIQSRNFTVDVAPQGHLLPPHNNLQLPHYGTSGIAVGMEIPNGDCTTWLSVAEHIPRQNLTASQPCTLKPCFTPC